jgi:hypothetical protein
MVMSGDQNARRNHSIGLMIVPLRGWNFSNVWEQPSYIKIPFRNILGRLKLWSACYRGAESFVCSLLSKNIKSKIYRTIILLVVLYGYETWSLTLREERRLEDFRDIWA